MGVSADNGDSQTKPLGDTVLHTYLDGSHSTKKHNREINAGRLRRQKTGEVLAGVRERAWVLL